jgi:hypothetical protein
MKLFKLLAQKIGHPAKGRKRAFKAQSLVEVAITFPLILMILSGVIEFGFMLNYYLSLVDATREAARTFSNFDPFNEDGSDNLTFYQSAASMVLDSLQPKSAADTSRKIVFSSGDDDVIISVFSVSGPGNVGRFPSSSGGEFRWFNNDSSSFTTADISSRLLYGAPNTGIILVEIFYDYHHTMSLPWIQLFLPDPVELHAYTMMPISAAEPTPTPLGP